MATRTGRSPGKSRGGPATRSRRGAGGSGTSRRSAKPRSARPSARTRKTGGATRRTARPAGRRQQDALGLLKAEHDAVNKLFDEFERAAHSRGASGGTRKAQLATEICRQLQAHATLEEEIFYPAATAAIDDDELIPEATVEHQSAKELIARIERMEPDDELYDATVMVLGEYVRHHVKEEQNELFPKVKRSGIDLVGLGQQMRDWRARATM